MVLHPLQHTHHFGVIYLTPLICIFRVVLVVCEQGKSYQGELVSLEEKDHLGMNTIRSSSMSKFLSYLYDYAYELESSYDLVMSIVYELEHSLCIMFLTCSSSFFIVHQISMNREKLGMR